MDVTAIERLKRVTRQYRTWATGNGATTEFALGKTVKRVEDLLVFVDGKLQRPAENGTAHQYSVRGLTPGYDGDKNMVKFTAAPGAVDLCFVQLSD